MPELTETQALPVLPLATGVVLPNTVATLTLETDEARAAVAAANDGDGRILLVPRIDGRYARVGTVAVVEESGELPNGLAAAIIRGLAPGHPRRRRSPAPARRSGSRPTTSSTGPVSSRAEDLGRELRAVLSVLAERRRSRRLPELLRTTTEAGALADGFGAWSDMPTERKVELLETVDIEARVERALELARDALAEHEVTEKIRQAGRRGHGEAAARVPAAPAAAGHPQGARRGPRTATRSRSCARRRAELDLPEAVADRGDREIDKLERTSEQSPEHGWIRTWLDTILELPWGVRSDERLDVTEARRILDEDHTGLGDVKDRIVEYLAVRKLRADRGLDDSARVRAARAAG